MNVGFIGLGLMGRPMALNLAAAGHTLQLWARRPASLEPFARSTAALHASPAEVARHADVIFTMVADAADVEAVCLGENGLAGGARSGTLVVDMSTIAPASARRIAERLEQHGIDFLDAPVSGGEKGAIEATLTIMAGGSVAAFERARPLLAVMGRSINHMGETGAGQVTKACNQTAQVVAIQGIAEAMLFAYANGVDGHKMVEALMSGFAGSKMLGLMGPKMAARDFAAGIEARLHHKDLGLIANMAESQHLDMPAVRLVHGQLQKLMQAGWGNMDTCNLLRVLEEHPSAKDGTQK